MYLSYLILISSAIGIVPPLLAKVESVIPRLTVIPDHLNTQKEEDVSSILDRLYSATFPVSKDVHLSSRLLNSIPPIPLIAKSPRESAILPTMLKLADPDRELVGYEGSDMMLNRWVEAVTAFHEDPYMLDVLSSAYAKHFGLNRDDINAIQLWTNQYLIHSGLPSALIKLPAYEGIMIRNTMLDADTIYNLDRALESGNTLQMSQFVKNKALGSEWRGDNVMAGTPDGMPQYQPGHYPFKLIVKTTTGRLIGPLSDYSDEGEVIIHSAITKGFGVLGKGQMRDGVIVYFLEELDSPLSAKL